MFAFIRFKMSEVNSESYRSRSDLRVLFALLSLVCLVVRYMHVETKGKKKKNCQKSSTIYIILAILPSPMMDYFYKLY